MDPAEQILIAVRTSLDMLGTEIIGFAQKKRNIAGRPGLPEDEKAGMIDAARARLNEQMETVFGAGKGSIEFDIQQIIDITAESMAADRDKAQTAAGIWRQELPGLKQYLQYCAALIEAHPGEISPAVRRSHKCLTEARVVMDGVSARVAAEAG